MSNTKCDICGKTVKPRGLGSHKRLQHGIVVREITIVKGVRDVPEELYYKADISEFRDGGSLNSHKSNPIKPQVTHKSTEEKTQVIRTLFGECCDCGRRIFLDMKWYDRNKKNIVCGFCITHRYKDRRKEFPNLFASCMGKTDSDGKQLWDILIEEKE